MEGKTNPRPQTPEHGTWGGIGAVKSPLEVSKEVSAFTYVKESVISNKKLVIHIGVCTTCGNIVSPVERRGVRKSGIVNVYVHEHPLAFLTLMDKDGKRSVRADPELADVVASVERVWVVYRGDVPEVRQEIIRWLMR